MFLNVNYLTFTIYYIVCDVYYQDTNYYKKQYLNLTDCWIKFLLYKYPNSKQFMLEQIKNQKQNIINNANKDIAPLKLKIQIIKDDAKKQISNLSKLEKSLTTKPQQEK